MAKQPQELERIHSDIRIMIVWGDKNSLKWVLHRTHHKKILDHVLRAQDENLEQALPQTALLTG